MMAEPNDPLLSSNVDPDPSRPASAGDHDESLDEAAFPWVIKDSLVARIHSKEFFSLLPASRRVGKGQLASPDSSTVLEFLNESTKLDRLNKVHNHLWLAGRPVPPRPLYVQKILNREIYITEDLDMHLVWGDGRMYLKPLPLFLLEPCFWTENFPCSCKSSPYLPLGQSADKKLCACKQLGQCRARSRGLLLSYAGLVSNESDHDIAIEKKLFPKCLTWAKWQKIARHVLNDPNLYSSIDRRFLYGELRLPRLNKIYFYWYTPGTQYKSQWNQYSSFFEGNLGFIVGTFAYVAIILTAMQVGLDTDLGKNTAFVSASYGFTIFVLLGLIVALGLIMIAFLYLFANNWVATKSFEKKREDELREYGITLRGSKGGPVS